MTALQFLRRRENCFDSTVLLIIMPGKMQGLTNISMSPRILKNFQEFFTQVSEGTTSVPGCSYVIRYADDEAE